MIKPTIRSVAHAVIAFLALMSSCAPPPEGPPEDELALDALDVVDLTENGSSLPCQVQTLFQHRCVKCHGAPDSEETPDLRAENLSGLVGAPSELRPDLHLVTAGDPAQSFLYIKMTRPDWSDGAVMPEDGVPRAADQALVRDWIAAGASEVCTPDAP